MTPDRLRQFLFCAALYALSLPVLAAESGSPRTTGEAYGVLHQLGLLQPPATPAAAAPAPQPDDAPAPQINAALPMVSSQSGDSALALASPAAAAVATDPLPSAYEMLRAKGLLPGGPVMVTGQFARPEPAPQPEDAPAPQINATLPMLSSQSGDSALALAAPAAAAVATDPLSRAYEMLRGKGLLPGGPVTLTGQFERPVRTGVERVVVDKSDRKLILFRNGQPYREYRISLGAIPDGPKQRAGDLRTPEGVYTLDWRNPHSRFYKSIHISYPNDTDRQLAKKKGVDPGGNIMIHGEHDLPPLQRTLRRARSPKDWTAGCIAVNNEQMDELWREVADGTPIEIRP